MRHPRLSNSRDSSLAPPNPTDAISMRAQKGPFTAEISTKFHSLIRSSPSLYDDGAFLLDGHGTSSRRLPSEDARHVTRNPRFNVLHGAVRFHCGCRVLSPTLATTLMVRSYGFEDAPIS